MAWRFWFIAVLFSSSPVWAIDLDLPQLVFSGAGSASFNWEVQQEMRLFGIPVVWRNFTASEPLEKTAELLGESTDRFQRVMAFKDRIMLSGVNGDWSWIAELELASRGVKGRVSALHIGAGRVQQALDQRASLIFNWLPAQAQLRFTQRSTVNKRNALQQLYSANMPLDNLNAYVQMHLRRTGWRDASAGSGVSGASVWHRKAARLVLIAQEQAGNSSSLFVHYFE